MNMIIRVIFRFDNPEEMKNLLRIKTKSFILQLGKIICRKHEKILEVSMLGTFRMQYGNHSFIIDRKSTTKTNRFQIILHAGTEG